MELCVGTGNRTFDGHAAVDGVVQFSLDRCTRPEIDVVGLIAAGDKKSACVMDDLRNRGIARRRAIGKDQRSDGVEAAELLNVGIVFVVAGGAQDEEVSAAGAIAEEFERFIEIVAPAHERKTRGGPGCCGVAGVSRADVGEVCCMR